MMDKLNMSVSDAAPYLAGLPIAAIAIDASERVVAMNPVAINLLGEGLSRYLC